MNRHALAVFALWLFVAASAPCAARPLALDPAFETGNSTVEQTSLPYIQCVPYARKVSGIQLYGDAHTWWGQAASRYARGTRPKVGAVMAFRPYGPMQLGHVAAISRIVDSRTVLLRHANWSLIDGRRGQTENNVRAVDVSPDNDWSEVRVWYAPLGGLGTTHWPVEGFIYNQKPLKNEHMTLLNSAPKVASVSRMGPDFLAGIAPENSGSVTHYPLINRKISKVAARPQENGRLITPASSLSKDPIGRIIASLSPMGAGRRDLAGRLAAQH